MSWNRTGQHVAGLYIRTYTVTGAVTSSRVKYGGRVQHTVKLDRPVTVFGRVAEVLLLDEEDLLVSYTTQTLKH